MPRHALASAGHVPSGVSRAGRRTRRAGKSTPRRSGVARGAHDARAHIRHARGPFSFSPNLGAPRRSGRVHAPTTDAAAPRSRGHRACAQSLQLGVAGALTSHAENAVRHISVFKAEAHASLRGGPVWNCRRRRGGSPPSPRGARVRGGDAVVLRAVVRGLPRADGVRHRLAAEGERRHLGDLRARRRRGTRRPPRRARTRRTRNRRPRTVRTPGPPSPPSPRARRSSARELSARRRARASRSARPNCAVASSAAAEVFGSRRSAERERRAPRRLARRRRGHSRLRARAGHNRVRHRPAHVGAPPRRGRPRREPRQPRHRRP